MGSNETATATTGGPRVIDVFDGNGAPSGPNYLLFSDADRLLVASRGRSGSGVSAYTAGAAASSIINRILSTVRGALAVLGQGLLPGLSESTRLLHRWRMRHRRLPTTRPTPRGLQEPIYPRKKCAIWTRWRPVPGKNVNYRRAPSSRRSGLVGPHTTPPIVKYKYMTSTL